MSEVQGVIRRMVHAAGLLRAELVNKTTEMTQKDVLKENTAHMLESFAKELEEARLEDAKEEEDRAKAIDAAVKRSETSTNEHSSFAERYQDFIDDTVHIMDILKCRIDSMKYLVNASGDYPYALDQLKEAYIHLSKGLVEMHLKRKKHLEALDDNIHEANELPQ